MQVPRLRFRDNARRELRAVKWFVMRSRMLPSASCPSFRPSPHDFPGEGRREAPLSARDLRRAVNR